MLETIYEADDENMIFDDDSSKSTNQRTRLSVYMCWCMITGCFLIITFIIVISLNPNYLSNNSISQSTQNILNTSHDSKDKLKLSNEIIDYLDSFSYEVNEDLDIELNPIRFLTSTISNSSLEILNQSALLWIYGHLKYPQSCINNIQCKENLHSKLKISFIELSDFLTTIELDSDDDKQIQLDWCNLIENLTTATFVSLVSIRTLNEKTMALDHLSCEDVDHNNFLSKIDDDLVSYGKLDLITIDSDSAISDNEKLIPMTDSNTNSIEKGEEINITRNNPVQYAKYNDDDNNQPPQAAHCPNDTAQYLLMWNSF